MVAVASSGTAVVTLPEATQILITREFDAPKHLVYRAYTEPDLIAEWWSGERGKVTSIEVDLRVGGTYRYVMEANGYPVAAMVLGIVMGTMVEQAFVTSLIKSDGSILPFFERPVSAVLAACTIAAFAWPLFVWVRRRFFTHTPMPVVEHNHPTGSP